MKEKILEITDGKYHYKNKDLERLFEYELIDFHQFSETDYTLYTDSIASTDLFNGANYARKDFVKVTLTKTGVNKGSWRIVKEVRGYFAL